MEKIEVRLNDGTRLKGRIINLVKNDLDVVLDFPEEFSGNIMGMHLPYFMMGEKTKDRRYLDEEGKLSFRGLRVAGNCLIEAYENAMDRKVDR